MENERTAETIRRNRAEEKFRRDMERIGRRVAALEGWRDEILARELAGTRAGRRILGRYDGHTPYGWEVACHPDGKWVRTARKVGWPAFSRIIEEARNLAGM